MAYFFEINTQNVTLNIIEVGDGVSLTSNDVIKYMPLPEGASKLALRYKLDDNFNPEDICPDKTDEEVLELVKLVPTETEVTLDVAKATKLNEIRQYFDNLINQLKTDAASYEVQTWEIQQLEYSRYIQDNTAISIS